MACGKGGRLEEFVQVLKISWVDLWDSPSPPQRGIHGIFLKQWDWEDESAHWLNRGQRAVLVKLGRASNEPFLCPSLTTLTAWPSALAGSELEVRPLSNCRNDILTVPGWQAGDPQKGQAGGGRWARPVTVMSCLAFERDRSALSPGTWEGSLFFPSWALKAKQQVREGKGAVVRGGGKC